MEWWRDPGWQFIGALISVLGIIVSYVFYRRQQRRRKLAYEVISNTSLISVKREVRSKLQVLFDAKPVDNLNLVVIRVFNAGNDSIITSDFETPVIMQFGDGSEILETEIVEVSPPDLHPVIERTLTEVSLMPMLLNSGDSVKLKMLVAGHNGRVNVMGRIVGVRQILGSPDTQLSLRSFRNNLIWIAVGSALSTLSFAKIFGPIVFGTDSIPAPSWWVAGTMMLAVTFLAIAMAYLDMKDTLR